MPSANTCLGQMYKSHITDNKTLLKYFFIIKNITEKNYFVTIDAQYPYTKISHKEGAETFLKNLEQEK